MRFVQESLGSTISVATTLASEDRIWEISESSKNAITGKSRGKRKNWSTGAYKHFNEQRKRTISRYRRYFRNNDNERSYKLDGRRKSGKIWNSRLKDAGKSELTFTSVEKQLWTIGKRRTLQGRKTDRRIHLGPTGSYGRRSEIPRGSHFASVFKVRDNLTD